MKNKPLVSVIMPFYNTKLEFMQEAIESVIRQRYLNWELLLIDDGSESPSSEFAVNYSNRFPEKIVYLEHHQHENRGPSASRQQGINASRGVYIAFLDADDIWLPHKLEEQLVIMETQPKAGMLYGDSLYWYSWTQDPDDAKRDFVPTRGIQPNNLLEPPKLLPLFLRGKTAIPCPCSILVRRSILDEIGGFVETFRNVYEDQAFYAKMCLKAHIFVADSCWDLYRQHPDSSVAVVRRQKQETFARMHYLNWLEEYMSEHGVQDIEVWQALQREQWRIHYPVWLPKNERIQYSVRWIKKWLLKLEECVAPATVQRTLWKHG